MTLKRNLLAYFKNTVKFLTFIVLVCGVCAPAHALIDAGTLILNTVSVRSDYTAGADAADSSVVVQPWLELIRISPLPIRAKAGDTLYIEYKIKNTAVNRLNIADTFVLNDSLTALGDSYTIVNSSGAVQYNFTVNAEGDTVVYAAIYINPYREHNSYDTVSFRAASAFNPDTVWLSLTDTYTISGMLAGFDTNINILTTDGRPLSLTLTAKDTHSNIIHDYSDTVYLSVSSGTITPQSVQPGSWLNGLWQDSITISGVPEHIDTVAVKAHTLNASGDTVQTEFIINYYGAPKVKINFPQSDQDTSVKFITLSGTAAQTSAGDSLAIYVNGVIRGDSLTLNSSKQWSIDNIELDGIGDSVMAVVKDMFGRFIYDTITVNYYADPSVTVTTPINDHDTKEQIITVSGVTQRTRVGDSIALYVNGALQGDSYVLGDSGGWSCTAALTGIGDSVVIHLFDAFGRMAYDTITVNFYDSPSITITSPEDNHETSAQFITISGTTANTAGRNGDIIELFINGAAQGGIEITTINGGWTLNNIELEDINDSVTAVLTDQFGRKDTYSITVNYFIPPAIVISLPPDGYDTNVKSLSASGTSSFSYTGDTITIYIDGNLMGDTVLMSNNGAWIVHNVLLDTYNHQLIVELTDRFNRKVYDTVTVSYFDTPSVAITEPADSYVYIQSDSTIIIGGHTVHISGKLGDTVEIFVNGVSRGIENITSLNGKWKFTVDISDTKADTVTVILTDQFGRIAAQTINVKVLEKYLVLRIENESEQPQLKFTSLKEKVYVTIFDPKKSNDTMVEIHVSSESDSVGFNMPLLEVEKDTNIFKGMFMFTEGKTGVYREGSIEPASSVSLIASGANSISYDMIYKIRIQGTEKIFIQYSPTFGVIYESTAEFIKEILENLDKVRTWPNPFMPLRHDNLVVQNLPSDQTMVIEIYNVAGERVRSLTVGNGGITFTATGNIATWDGRNERGQYVASGTYVYLVRSETGHIVRKLTLIK